MLLAAAGVQRRDRDWATCLQVNVQDAAAWIRAAAELGVAKAVVAGTALEYRGYGTLPDRPWRGANPPPLLVEDDPLEVADPYGASKAAGGIVVRAVAREMGQTLSYLRLAPVYGAGDDPEKLLPGLIRALKRDETFELSGGAQVREWLYVADATSALLAATGTVTDGRVSVLNVGTGRGLTVAHVATALADLLGARRDLVRLGALAYGSGEAHYRVMDSTGGQRALTWKARVSLEEGLADLLRTELT